MSAYNRITKRFVDGQTLNAADFNAALDDMMRMVTAAIATALAGATGVTPPVVIPIGTTLAFSDSTLATFSDGSALTFSS